jgi:hypothetical protein
MKTAAAAALLAAAPLLASAADPLQPMAFLAGHCFRGEVAAKDTDEHCFRWILGGKALRDVHTVRGAGHPDYVGETTYYYDSGAQRIEYIYIENAGGLMRGTVEPGEGAFVFPATTFVAPGQALTLRVRWTLMADGYEAWSEAQDKGAWATMFKVKMTKAS